MQYTRLLIMTVLSFICMYILMYLMVNSYQNVYANLNQFYMAGIMTIPMVIIELLVMSPMYTNSSLNKAIIALSIFLFILLIAGLRKQTAITDSEFLKSMIPHHASALLMCDKAHINDPEIKSLCKNILTGQQSEINFMKSKLTSLSAH